MSEIVRRMSVSITEKRVDVDGSKYTKADFIRYYGEEGGQWQWDRAGKMDLTQFSMMADNDQHVKSELENMQFKIDNATRIDCNGERYSLPEFIAFYGEGQGLYQWKRAGQEDLTRYCEKTYLTQTSFKALPFPDISTISTNQNIVPEHTSDSKENEKPRENKENTVSGNSIIGQFRKGSVLKMFGQKKKSQSIVDKFLPVKTPTTDLDEKKKYLRKVSSSSSTVSTTISTNASDSSASSADSSEEIMTPQERRMAKLAAARAKIKKYPSIIE